MTPSAPTLRPGEQLASTVCSTRVVVIHAPAEQTPVIACGGSPMVAAMAAQPSASRVSDGGTLIGKRYVNAAGSLELLCTSSGSGELSCDGVAMTRKSAKPLPASD